jgi:hypothetical protein
MALSASAPVEAADVPDAGAFSVKNGRVFKNGTEVDCDEVYTRPEGISNGITSWALFSESALTEAETGIWFFGEDGKYKAFVPHDIQTGHQQVLWSPGGGWFVLMSGPGAGPWGAYVTYELWSVDGDGMNKKAEFDGIEDHIAWMPDGERFVFARADGTRDTSDMENDPYAPKVSAVLYDSAAGEEIVLKEATETQNYYLGGQPWENDVRIVTLDGEDIALSEESVKSPEDWGGAGMEAGKYERRDIEVPIPPAG